MTSEEPANEITESDLLTLRVLSTVSDNAAISQRALAKEMGVALGLAHAYLKRCVRKGLVKVGQVPSRRYAYFVTPRGFAEKSRLTAEYLHQSFRLYRVGRRQCVEVMALAAERSWRRVALVGAGDIAEIAVLCAVGGAVELVGLVAPGFTEPSFLGLPVVDDLAAFAPPVDAALITGTDGAQALFDQATQLLPAERVLTLPFMKILTAPVVEGG